MKTRCAFTLIELLVSLAVVALLIALLAPGLAAARGRAREAVCISNLRQLGAAVHLYAADHDGHAPPGAASFRTNLHRWHGTRLRVGEAFRPEGAPVTPYISADAQPGVSHAIRECPTFAPTLRRLGGSGLGFERSAGGYGYNNAYLGVHLARAGVGRHVVRDDRAGARLVRFANPGRAIALTDAAFPDRRAPDRVIEYSFAEPRFHPAWAPDGRRMDPSIHFRHAGRAGVVWLDGHAGAEAMTFSHDSGLYDPPAAEVGIGWFGRDDDNGLFDYGPGGR
jgi:prepilin-type N-terminal cleavage/methylation domain-containing protein/prepilin-type processing-associated H-X9-DG protein